MMLGHLSMYCALYEKITFVCQFRMRKQGRKIKMIRYLTTISPLGGHSTFFGGCVPCGFQNVGSRERIFLENGGLGNKNVENFWSRELEFCPKHGWKCINFLKIENGGRTSGLLRVNLTLPHSQIPVLVLTERACGGLTVAPDMRFSGQILE